MTVKRRERIARVAEAKKAATSTGKEVTYWITREMSTDGVLSEHIDVWLVKPDRKVYPGGVGSYWVAPDIKVRTAHGEMPARMGTWSIDQCLRACRVYPDDNIQCIRVGDDPPAPVAD